MDKDLVLQAFFYSFPLSLIAFAISKHKIRMKGEKLIALAKKERTIATGVLIHCFVPTGRLYHNHFTEIRYDRVHESGFKEFEAIYEYLVRGKCYRCKVHFNQKNGFPPKTITVFYTKTNPSRSVAYAKDMKGFLYRFCGMSPFVIFFITYCILGQIQT